MKSQGSSNPELSLIVPTYNERENIVPLMEQIHKSLSAYSYELIIVDDNSPDGTSELAKSLSSKYPVSVIVRTPSGDWLQRWFPDSIRQEEKSWAS